MAAAACVAAAFMLAGCQPAQPPSFQATDITGAGFARDFRLTDHNGREADAGDFKGKVVAVFFAISIARMSAPPRCRIFRLRCSTGTQADRVQVIFVTVDPQRDTRIC